MIRQTKFHFNLRKMRPALCGYCRKPAGPHLRITEEQIYGACSLEHLNKMREEKPLKKIAVTCTEGLDYTINQTKKTYVDIAKRTGSYVMHEWDRKDRELLFGAIVDNYLTWANEQARTGKMEKVIQDGSN